VTGQVTAAAAACDVLVVGAGTAGIPAAVAAARRGARVLLADAEAEPGGTLRRAAGHVSAGGTRLQREKGIDDDPDAHAADIMRITRGTADEEMVALACALAPRTVAWLDELGLDWDPSCPAILHALEAYSVPRTYWGRRKALSIADALAPELAREVEAGRVAWFPRHRLAVLETDGGAVAGGVFHDADGHEVLLRAGSVVLTSGGYAADPGIFAQMTGGLPLYGAAEPANRGDGLVAARAVGAAVRPARHFLPNVGGIEDPPGSRRVSRADNPVLVPARPPWEVYVDRDGRRRLREDEPDRPTMQRALARLPGMTFWIIWDAAVAAAAPTPLLPSWEGPRLEAAWNVHPAFVRADTVEGLAEAAGIDTAGLAATLADYNAALADGRPDPLSRVHRPMPIGSPPFFAVRNHGTTSTASGGLMVDRDCRVLDQAGLAIRGLYAAGEILGRELLSGDAFVGGMSLTPAIAFGRRLGEEILSW